jgi:hypothetical protein
MFYVLNMHLSRLFKIQVGVPNWFQVNENRTLIEFLTTSSC